MSLSDNITPQKKPELPIPLNLGENYDFMFALKPQFQVAEPFIGPFVITCELDDIFLVYRKDSEIIKPNIVSPPPSLEISMKNLRPPLIDKSFPMEFLIENKSKGDANEISIITKLPQQLKLIRGALKKQMYSLSSNDKITWEINLKPLEAGDYIIELDIEFKDPDGNKYEVIKKFPLAIKL